MTAATPAPSVSPDPAGEASKRVEQLLTMLFPEWDADQREHIASECATAALASSPIPKTFPREAVAEAIRLVEYDMLNRAGHGADGFVAERKEVAQIIEAYRALLQEDRQS